MKTGPSLAEVLRVSRRVLRALDPNREGSLRRVDGGFLLRAPRVSLAIRAHSVEVGHWNLSGKRLAATLEFIARLLDVNPTNAPLVAQATLPDGQMKPSLSTTLVDDAGGFAVAGHADDSAGAVLKSDDDVVDDPSR